jgi:hypothetical protein
VLVATGSKIPYYSLHMTSGFLLTWTRDIEAHGFLVAPVQRVGWGSRPAHPGDVGGDQVPGSWGAVCADQPVARSKTKHWRFQSAGVMVINTCKGKTHVNQWDVHIC